jgi:hypothetical protein
VIDMVPPGVRPGIVRGISYGLFGKFARTPLLIAAVWPAGMPPARRRS